MSLASDTSRSYPATATQDVKMCHMPQTPGTHGSGHRAPTRRGSITGGRVTALLVGAPAIGMFFGGAVFAVLSAGAATLAALRVRPEGLWWVLPMAPVAVWAVCVSRAMFDAAGGGGKQAIAVAHGAIDAFPAMTVTLLATAAVAFLRRAARRRSVGA
ncbi:hypothetical protein Caci_1913 [Catenulispora acidiphila DSM 44928]|uniref:DUF6542 domain-containing protein n=2 Tax=Catenulispora TaxID=414878 RepID=C7QEE2_CATAD|nr:hypothetical protein Caci_1913 [Catenulispora acidiphila DSM 44928]